MEFNPQKSVKKYSLITKILASVFFIAIVFTVLFFSYKQYMFWGLFALCLCVFVFYFISGILTYNYFTKYMVTFEFKKFISVVDCSDKVSDFSLKYSAKSLTSDLNETAAMNYAKYNTVKYLNERFDILTELSFLYFVTRDFYNLKGVMDEYDRLLVALQRSNKSIKKLSESACQELNFYKNFLTCNYEACISFVESKEVPLNVFKFDEYMKTLNFMIMKGACLYQMGDFDGAKEEFEKIAKVDKNSERNTAIANNYLQAIESGDSFHIMYRFDQAYINERGKIYTEMIKKSKRIKTVKNFCIGIFAVLSYLIFNMLFTTEII